MKIIFVFLLFISIAAGTTCPRPPTEKLSERELEVYRALLGEKPKQIVVIGNASVEAFGLAEDDGLKKVLPGLQSDTLANYLEAIAAPVVTEDDNRSAFAFPIVTHAEFEAEASESFRFYYFSRVGFSADGRQAIVQFSQIAEPLGSKGAFYLLTKEADVWKIAYESESWHS